MFASSETSRSSSRRDIRKAQDGRLRPVLRLFARALPCALRRAAMISGYLGKSDEFDKAIATFSFAYADQNEKDHAALKRAIRDGRVKAVVEKAK